jgi:hypothetical protein
MCGTCKLNPEQCSKYVPATACGTVCGSGSDCMMVVKERHDVHKMVTAEFSNYCVALLYILFVILVGFHLNHAIQSAFHTLGIEGPKFTPIMRLASIGLAVILVGLFSVLPFGVIVSNLFGIDLVSIVSCITGGCL